MESPRLGLWCPSTSLQPQESKGMKTGMRWEWRLSSPLPNEKQLPACKQQTVWGKTEFWYHIKPENFYISCRIWIVYFSLLVLQVYNKLRMKYTFFFFFFSWPLTLFPTMSGFPSKLPSANLKNMLPTSGREKGIQHEMPSRAWRSSQRERKRERARAHACAWAEWSLSNRKKREQEEVRTVGVWDVEAGVYLGAGWRYYTNLIVGIICCISHGHLWDTS